MTCLPRRLPALLSFSGDEGRLDGWGWLLELSASGARVSTRSPLRPGQRVWLSFEAAGGRWDGAPAEVRGVEEDGQGFRLAEARFVDPVLRKRLAVAILELLAS